MQDLIFEYKRTLRDTNNMLKEFENKVDADLSAKDMTRKKIINRIVSDLRWTIEWLESGRQPNAKRGYDVNHIYMYKDPKVIEALSEEHRLIEHCVTDISEQEREVIAKALSVLTEREEDIYLMRYVQNLTYREIGMLLCISESTVRVNLNRSRAKIDKCLQATYPCTS